MNIDNDKSRYKPPFSVVLLDAIDANHYSDIIGKMDQAASLEDYGKAVALADALFVPERKVEWKRIVHRFQIPERVEPPASGLDANRPAIYFLDTPLPVHRRHAPKRLSLLILALREILAGLGEIVIAPKPDQRLRQFRLTLSLAVSAGAEGKAIVVETNLQ